jgi:hypothetical protein
LSRAETCHQLHRRIQTLNALTWSCWSALYVIGFADNFYDESCRYYEAERLLYQCLAFLRAIAASGLPVVLTVSAPRKRGREHFLQLVAKQTDLLWEPEESAPQLPQSRQLELLLKTSTQLIQEFEHQLKPFARGQLNRAERDLLDQLLAMVYFQSAPIAFAASPQPFQAFLLSMLIGIVKRLTPLESAGMGASQPETETQQLVSEGAAQFMQEFEAAWYRFAKALRLEDRQRLEELIAMLSQQAEAVVKVALPQRFYAATLAMLMGALQRVLQLEAQWTRNPALESYLHALEREDRQWLEELSAMLNTLSAIRMSLAAHPAFKPFAMRMLIRILKRISQLETLAARDPELARALESPED